MGIFEASSATGAGAARRSLSGSNLQGLGKKGGLTVIRGGKMCPICSKGVDMATATCIDRTQTKPENPYSKQIQSSEATLPMKWSGSYADFLRQLANAWDKGYAAHGLVAPEKEVKANG